MGNSIEFFPFNAYIKVRLGMSLYSIERKITNKLLKG